MILSKSGPQPTILNSYYPLDLTIFTRVKQLLKEWALSGVLACRPTSFYNFALNDNVCVKLYLSQPTPKPDSCYGYINHYFKMNSSLQTSCCEIIKNLIENMSNRLAV